MSDTEFIELKDELFYIKIGVFILIASVFLIAFVSINVLLKVLCSKKAENNSQQKIVSKEVSNKIYCSTQNDEYFKPMGKRMSERVITEENTYDELKPAKRLDNPDNFVENVEYEEIRQGNGKFVHHRFNQKYFK